MVLSNFLSQAKAAKKTTQPFWIHYSPVRRPVEPSPHPRREKEVALVLETQTRLEEHLQPIPLPRERVDDVGAGLDERGLEHVAQERQHRVERLELGLSLAAVRDAGEQLGEDGEVENERRGEEGVLALVEYVLRRQR
jgi:hypothetical protein